MRGGPISSMPLDLGWWLGWQSSFDWENETLTVVDTKDERRLMSMSMLWWREKGKWWV